MDGDFIVINFFALVLSFVILLCIFNVNQSYLLHELIVSAIEEASIKHKTFENLYNRISDTNMIKILCNYLIGSTTFGVMCQYKCISFSPYVSQLRCVKSKRNEGHLHF